MTEYYRSEYAEKIGNMVKPFTGLIGVVALGMGLAVYIEPMGTVDADSVVAVTLLPLIGYIMGSLIAKVCHVWYDMKFP